MRKRSEIKEMSGRIERAQHNGIPFKKGITEDYIRGLLHGLQFAVGMADIEIFQHEQ